MLRGRIGIAQYLDSQNIGYWQYVSICPRSAFSAKETPRWCQVELIFGTFSRETKAQRLNIFRILILYLSSLSLKGMRSFLWFVILNFTPAPLRNGGQKGVSRYIGYIGSDILISKSDILLGLPVAQYCQYPILSRYARIDSTPYMRVSASPHSCSRFEMH